VRDNGCEALKAQAEMWKHAVLLVYFSCDVVYAQFLRTSSLEQAIRSVDEFASQLCAHIAMPSQLWRLPYLMWWLDTFATQKEALPLSDTESIGCLLANTRIIADTFLADEVRVSC
jgi:hypothetical protein